MATLLSVWLPTWSADLARRRLIRAGRLPNSQSVSGGSASPEHTILVAREAAQRMETHACCARSLALGVRPGMSITHARALVGTSEGRVLVVRHRPEREAAALESLARSLTRFTPVIAPDPDEPGVAPDLGGTGLILDLRGLWRVARSRKRLALRIVRSLTRLGIHARVGVAPTSAGAWALARYAPEDSNIVVVRTEAELGERTAVLPVVSLRLPEDTVDALREVGLERVGEVGAMDRASLSVRFGGEVVRRLDLVTGVGGVMEPPIEPVRVPEPIRALLACDGPTTHLESIEAGVRDVLGRVASQLEERDLGARRVAIRLERLGVKRERGGREDVWLEVATSAPSRDAGHLWKLAQPQLARVDLGFGIESMEAIASRVGRVRAEQGRMDRMGGVQEGAARGGPRIKALGEVVDALVSRLGDERVTRVRVRATHIPERVFAHESVSRLGVDNARRLALSVEEREASVARATGGRPSVVLASALPAEVVAIAPDGPPVRVRWAGTLGRWVDVVRAIGPERIEGEWWSSDEPARDLYRVLEDGSGGGGRWLWMWRRRAESQRVRWFIGGIWA